jgi:tetratricopeptide (TPR) repeat protein
MRRKQKMFCSNCGKEIKEGAKFCPGCGHPVAMQAASQPVVQQEPQFRNTVQQPAQPKAEASRVPIVAIVVVALILLCLLGFLAYQKFGDRLPAFLNKDDAVIVEGEQPGEDAGQELDQADSTDEAGGETASGETDFEEEVDYLAQAQAAYDSGSYSVALQYCDMAMQADASNASVYALESDIYVAQGEYEQAATMLNDGYDATEAESLLTQKEQLKNHMIVTSCIEYDAQGTVVCEVEYDEDGNPTTYTNYSDGRTITDIEEKTYDNEGDNSMTTHYDSGMNIQWQETYEYDTNGNVTKCEHYDAKGQKEWYDKYSYDSDNRQTGTTRYNADNTVSWWDEYTYDGDTSVTKTAHPSTGDVVVIQIEYTYDDYGNETSYQEDYGDDSGSFWEKEYNAFDDVVKYTYGDTEINYVYTYDYMS